MEAPGSQVPERLFHPDLLSTDVECEIDFVPSLTGLVRFAGFFPRTYVLGYQRLVPAGLRSSDRRNCVRSIGMAI